MKLKADKIAVLFATTLLAACMSVGERTTASVTYYTVSGDSFKELDREIRLHGPNVTGVGKALASTNLSIQPNIRYADDDIFCHISSARINVKARITLPRHSDESSLRSDLARSWNNLKEYARVHEAVHVAIADKHALMMEEELQRLKPKPTCDELEQDVAKLFVHMFRLHHAEQVKFDEDEKKRIRKLNSVAAAQ